MSNEQLESSNYNTPDGSNGTELAEHDGSPQQMQIGAGGFGQDGDLPPLVDEGGSKVNSSAFIIAFVLVCTAGVIFWMRSTSAKNNLAMGETTEVESEIESILDAMIVGSDGSPIQDGADVLSKLTDDRTELQVSVEDVKANPFIWVTDASNEDAPTTPDGTPEVSEYEQNRIDTQLAIEAASKQITVNTIMSGSNPLAYVNGKFVRVGDILKVGNDKIPFRIEAIESESVELIAESEEFNLQLGFTVSLKR